MEMPDPIDTSYVGQQVRQLRGELGLDLVDLSAKLEPLGVTLGKNALSKLETGGRKISVEELIALAVALGVTPNRLLLGGIAGDGDRQVEIAHTWVLSIVEAWQWAQAERYPDAGREGSGAKLKSRDFLLNRAFRERNLPHNPPLSIPVNEYRDLVSQGIFANVDESFENLERLGVDPRVLIQHIDLKIVSRTFQRLAQQAVEDDDGQHQDS